MEIIICCTVFIIIMFVYFIGMCGDVILFENQGIYRNNHSQTVNKLQKYVYSKMNVIS